MALLALDHATIAVVTALSHEFVAVRLMLSATKRCTAASGRIFQAALIRNCDGYDHCVVIAPSGMGNMRAAQTIHDLYEDCPRLQHAIFCGIAGGTPDPSHPERHVRLGDVVVSVDFVLSYGHGKEHADRQEPRSQVVAMLEGPLRAAVRRLENGAQAGERPWEGYIDQLIQRDATFQRPPPETDQLIEPSPVRWLSGVRWCDRRVPHPLDPARAHVPLRPRVFPGHIASADVVQANPRRRDAFRDSHEIRAFEMEGYGFSFDALSRQLDYIVVRGICDYANPRKNRSSEQQWQRYAANVAAAYTLALIRELAVRVPWQLTEALDYKYRLQQTRSPPTAVETEIFQSMASAVVAPLTAEAATADSSGPRTTDSAPLDPEAAQKLAKDLLEGLKRADDLLKVFDFDTAYELADQIERQALALESTLTRSTCAEVFSRLAKLQISQAEYARIKDPGAPVDYSRAREMAERARKAGGGNS